MIILVLTILGLCLGSFINALIWRLHEQERIINSAKTKSKVPRKLSILYGRSICPKCEHTLAPKDLIPIFSWLMLKGKCRYCGKTISWQYPLVELITAVIFVFSYLVWSIGLQNQELFQFVFWIGFLTGLIALVVYDIKWLLLPNKILYPLILLAIVQVIILAIWNKEPSVALSSILGAVILGGLFYVLFQISSGQWIGGGDVKLGLLLGLLVGGPLKSFLVLFFASTLGSLFALWLALNGKAHQSTHIAFGPFLITAGFVVYLFGHDITNWYLNIHL